MTAFIAANFSYDGIISSEYGLRITSDDSTSSAGANVQLYTQKIYRRPKTYLLGIEQTPVLSIPIRINVPDQLSATEDSVISKWLFGRQNYKKLQIIQSDMEYVYFNCIFMDKQTERIGNIIRGYYANIVCDSPFAWTYPKTKTYSYPSGYLINDNIQIVNSSDMDDYTYPSMSFTMNVFGGDLSIINTSDSNREFLFEGLSANETITIDNDLEIITSSVSGVNRLSNFTDYKWMRYKPGINNLQLSGNISSISFTNQFAKKMS